MRKHEVLKGLIGLFTVVALVAFVPAASADHVAGDGRIVGAGGGGGFEYASGDPPIQNCPGQEFTGTFPGSRFELDHVGTYDGADQTGIPVASYVGPTHVQIKTGPYIINPEGTYKDCDTPGEDEINDATITSQAATGLVSCPNLKGFWQRRAFDVVEFRLHGLCEVTGNQPGLTQKVVDHHTTHIITGLMHPCYYPVPVEEVPPGGCQVDQNASSVLVTDYVVIHEEVLNEPLPPL